MASSVFSTVRKCKDCTRLRGAHFKHLKLIKLFPAAASLEFVNMVLLGSLVRTARESAFILFTADRLIKMTRCVPSWNTTAATASNKLF